MTNLDVTITPVVIDITVRESGPQGAPGVVQSVAAGTGVAVAGTAADPVVSLNAASTVERGGVELATNLETLAGIDPTLAVTPASGKAAYLTSPTITGSPTVPLLQMAVLDPSGARYAIRQALNTFESGTYTDATMNIGYNVSATPGVKAVAGQPMLFLQFESKFRHGAGTPYLSELHVNFNGTNAALPGLIRPIALTVEHATHIVDLLFVADTFRISDNADATRLQFSSNTWAFWKPVMVIGGAAAQSLVTIGDGLNGAALVLNRAAAVGSNRIEFKVAGANRWWIYDATDIFLYFRDMVNSRMQVQLTPGANSNAAYTDFNSNVRVTGSTNEIGPTTNRLTVNSLTASTQVWLDTASSSNADVSLELRSKGTGAIVSNTAHRFLGNVGFYGTTPVAKQTGVAVNAAGIHAALVTLGLIAA